MNWANINYELQIKKEKALLDGNKERVDRIWDIQKQIFWHKVKHPFYEAQTKGDRNTTVIK